VVRRRIVTLGLGYLVATLAITGAWALLFPMDFWNRYPGFGLEFVGKLPAYNEHLLNDFGSLSLAFAVLFGIAAVRPSPVLVRASLAAFLVYAVPHFVFHATHLAPFDTAEAVTQVVLLGSYVAVPVLLVALSPRPAPASERG
jgi:hypothetical protein